MTHNETLKKIRGEIERYLKKRRKGQTGEKKYTLMTPYYGAAEIIQVIDSLLKKQITLNQNEENKVQIFEDLWKEYIGKKEGIMTNSGSSANLMALQLLTNPTVPNHLKLGDEIITPALTWTTTVSPIWAVHCKPVFVDVDLNSFTIKTDEIEKAITPKTRAIMLVHLLGFPCDMTEIMRIAKKHRLFVIEDCCESHGAEIHNKKAGSFGHLSTFSFFFSHHLTTMEGGMVLTDNEEFAEIIRTMRSQGVIRNCRNEHFKNRYFKNEKYKDIQKAYLFSNIGFNVRPTEINGGFGIEQFKKFPNILQSRIRNARFFINLLRKYSEFFHTPDVPKSVKHAWFGLPIHVKDGAPLQRKEFEAFLNKKGVETRQIMAGDITIQPAFALFKSRVSGDLKNTKLIHKNAFFVGNHPLIREKERQFLSVCFKEFLRKYK